MLREILSNGFKDKNMQISGNGTPSPDKSSKRKNKKPPSINQLNILEKMPNLNQAVIDDKKIDILKIKLDKPIFNEKINFKIKI